jgi:hypothetical protein
MTVAPASPAASQQAAVDAALLILERMGLSPDDLTTATRQRLPIPTFADYVPVVSAAVTDGTRRAYGTCRSSPEAATSRSGTYLRERRSPIRRA